MVGKSHHKKKKHSFRSKKREIHQGRPAEVAQQPAIAKVHEPVPPPGVPAPEASAPPKVEKPTVVLYPYIATELKTIGILAGIMVIILFVLFLIL